MNRANLLLNRVLQLLGWPGVVAIGILMFSVAFYVNTAAPARQKLTSLQTRVASLHAQLPKQSATHAEIENPVKRIDAYYGSFPAVEELPTAIAETLSAARQHGLAVDQADYSYDAGRRDELTAFQMSFALKGPYPKIRAFLMALLRAQPAMALDDVSFRRDGIAVTEVEAKVRLTFYVTSLPWNR